MKFMEILLTKKSSSPHNGLISVIFKPEHQKLRTLYPGKHGNMKTIPNYNNESRGMARNMYKNDVHEAEECYEEEEVEMSGGLGMFDYEPKPKAGLTAMSDNKSKQTFTSVDGLDYDLSLTTTINLRLVAT